MLCTQASRYGLSHIFGTWTKCEVGDYKILQRRGSEMWREDPLRMNSMHRPIIHTGRILDSSSKVSLVVFDDRRNA